MSQIPLKFSGDFSNHYNIGRKHDTLRVSFPELGQWIAYPHTEGETPMPESIEKHTPNCKIYKNVGYSIKNLHEFLITVCPRYIDFDYKECFFDFNLEDVEVSVGEPTPLAIYIFSKNYDEDWHGLWEDIRSLRIHGINADEVELYLYNALIYISELKNIDIELLSIEIPYWDYAEENEQQIEQKNLPIFKDIEPTQLYFYGMQEKNHMSAFLYFYRIIEYYASKFKIEELGKKRSDGTITPLNFFKEIKNICREGERENICIFIKGVVPESLVNKAFKANLIDSKDVSRFASGLYDFRCGLVHSKYERKEEIVVESILDRTSDVKYWTNIISSLAREIINEFAK